MSGLVLVGISGTCLDDAESDSSDIGSSRIFQNVMSNGQRE